MKTVTLGINGVSNKNSLESINYNLPPKEELINIIRTSGYNSAILNEEYFRALEEQKNTFQ